MIRIPVGAQWFAATGELQTKEHVAEVLHAEPGDLAEIEVKVDGVIRGTVWFIPDPDLVENLRGRAALAHLFRWHMVIRGDLFIGGLDEEDQQKIITFLEH